MHKTFIYFYLINVCLQFYYQNNYSNNDINSLNLIINMLWFNAVTSGVVYKFSQNYNISSH